MATEVVNLLEASRLDGSETQPMWTVFDGGPYRTLEILFQLFKNGSGGTLVVEHAPVLRDDAFVPLDDASWSLSTTPTDPCLHVPHFMRYIRWKYTSAAGDPIAAVILVAKD